VGRNDEGARELFKSKSLSHVGSLV
jgi:hypothetical protein